MSAALARTTTMATKRNNAEVNSADDLRKLLSWAITSDSSAEVALLHIMEEHNFSLSLLQTDLDWFRSFCFDSRKLFDLCLFLTRRRLRRKLF